MSEYELHIPHRGPDQPVLDAIDDTRLALEGDDRAVARGVLTERLLAGDETVGEVIEHLESVSSEERRAIADRAREDAGLLSFTEVEKNQELARIRRWPPKPPSPPPAKDRIQTCHAEGCEEVSSRPGWGPSPTPVRKWWCPRHRDQAAPGDLDPPKPSVRVDRFGHWREPPHVEKFYSELYSKMAREFEESEAQKVAERERIAKLEVEHRGTLRPPAGFRPPHYGEG